MDGFMSVIATSKAEQLRAWAVVEARLSIDDVGPMRAGALVDRAHEIEQFVLNGKASPDE